MAPSAAVRPAFLPADDSPFLRRNSSAAFTSPAAEAFHISQDIHTINPLSVQRGTRDGSVTHQSDLFCAHPKNARNKAFAAPVSASAFLQSIMPAPDLSRSSLTIFAETCAQEALPVQRLPYDAAELMPLNISSHHILWLPRTKTAT